MNPVLISQHVPDVLIPCSTVLWGSSLSRDNTIFSWNISRRNQTIHIQDESPQGVPNSIPPPNTCIGDLISSVPPFFNPVFTDFFQHLIVKVCVSVWLTLTRGLCPLYPINTIKIMSRTAHFSKDASCSSSKSGSGCSSCESWFLSAWAMWRDWQFYCFGPSLLQSLSHTSHRRASFHLPAPSPVPWLVLISEPHVCVRERQCECVQK